MIRRHDLETGSLTDALYLHSVTTSVDAYLGSPQ